MFFRKKLLFLIGIVFCCICVCYHIPENLKFETYATPYTQKEDNIIGTETDLLVKVEIKKYNYFFRPSKTIGCIYFMGNTYQDIYSIGGDVFKHKKLLENIKLKFEGVRYDFFVNSQAVELGLSMDKWYEDTISIVNFCDDGLVFAHRDKDTGITSLYTVSIDGKEEK